MSSKKITRYKLLLDEGLPPKERFSVLNNFYSVKHIYHDIGKGGSKDPVVYKIAEKGKYMVVVFNTKDFKPLIEEKKPSVISLSTGLSNKQIDLKLCSLLKKMKHHEQKGHLISVSNEGVIVKKITKQA